MAASESDKPALQTDTVPKEQLDVVDTPTSPTSTAALSRFEFETGKGNEGTKILLVEWDTSALPPPQASKQTPHAPLNNGEVDGARSARKESATGEWEVTWEGKAKVIGVRDRDADAGLHRVYFFLPPGSHIPALVSITPQGAKAEGKKSSDVLRTKPMPAIFPPALGGTGSEAGRRGVLHTLWARKRLAELQAEIVAEMKANGESVGLEMAMQERQWIVDHFGLAPADGVPRPTRLHIPAGAPAGPASPRSPVGGKLGEKLRGLKLATSPIDLAAAAVAAKSAQPKADGAGFSATAPRQIPQSSGGIGSLDAIVGSSIPPPTGGPGNTEEDLFALPMSPRSPDMSKSPFSFLK